MLDTPPAVPAGGNARRPTALRPTNGRARPVRAEPIVRVLDEDPELVGPMPAEDLALARRAAVAHVLDLDPGPWPSRSRGRPGMFGFLVLEGVLGVRTETTRQSCLELLGPGDVVRPWLQLAAETTPVRDAQAVALSPLRVAVLDTGFAARVARWPQVAAGVMDRLVLRTRRLSYQLAVFSLPRVEDRLELTVWHFAERWGRVTPSGVVVDLPVTHSQLAEVIGVRRPSVTTALGALERRGVIRRAGHHRIVLLGEPPGFEGDAEPAAGVAAG